MSLLSSFAKIVGVAWQGGKLFMSKGLGPVSVAWTGYEIYSQITSLWNDNDVLVDRTIDKKAIQESLIELLCNTLMPSSEGTASSSYNPYPFLVACSSGRATSITTMAMTRVAMNVLGGSIGVLCFKALRSGDRYTKEEQGYIKSLVAEFNATTKDGEADDLKISDELWLTLGRNPIIRQLGRLLYVAHLKAKSERITEADTAFDEGRIKEGWEAIIDYLDTKASTEVAPIISTVEGNESVKEWSDLAAQIPDIDFRGVFRESRDPSRSYSVDVAQVMGEIARTLKPVNDTNNFEKRARVATELRRMADVVELNLK